MTILPSQRAAFSSITSMRVLSCVVAVMLLVLSPRVALADLLPDDPQKKETPETDPNAESNGLPWKVGPESLHLGHDVTLALPSGYRFLGQPEAGQEMAKVGNLYNDNLLGVVLSEKPEDAYMVSIRYEEEGFIKDDETLDADAILSSIREGQDAYNAERKKLGFPALHADGWQEVPRYEKAKHQMVWALLVSDETGPSVNLNTRLLGRRGYVSINLVTDPKTLPTYRSDGVAILAATTFDKGARYEDYESGKDKIAEYGLTGLVLGGVGFGVMKAAKIGILAKILLMGKKFFVVLFAGVAALARKLLGKKKDAESPTSPPGTL